MIENLIAIFAGIALLVWSADRFVLGAAATAEQLNVSPLVIGLERTGDWPHHHRHRHQSP